MVWAANLAAVAEVRAVERDRFQAVLLDEYQDTGHAQIALLSGLFDDGHRVMAVGDPFQSIYSWRGASAANINRFAETFRHTDGAPATTFTLSTSWRNDRAILDVANEVATELRAAHPLAPVEAGRRLGRRQRGRGPAGHGRGRSGLGGRAAALGLGRGRAADPDRERTAAVLVRRRTQIPLLAGPCATPGCRWRSSAWAGCSPRPRSSTSSPPCTSWPTTRAGRRCCGYSPARGGASARATWSCSRAAPAAGQRHRRPPTERHAASGPTRQPAPARRLTAAVGATGTTIRWRSGRHGGGRGNRPRRDPGSIVEALDDLGDLSRYSPGGPRLAGCR